MLERVPDGPEGNASVTLRCQSSDDVTLGLSAQDLAGAREYWHV